MQDKKLRVLAGPLLNHLLFRNRTTEGPAEAHRKHLVEAGVPGKCALVLVVRNDSVLFWTERPRPPDLQNCSCPNSCNLLFCIEKFRPFGEIIFE